MYKKKLGIVSFAVSSLFIIVNADEKKTSTSLNDITVVSASGFEQNLADAAATISVISADELAKKSYTDVTDVLKNVPGVYINGGGSQQSIMIRGMATSYTLFLIDGKPMQSTGAFELNGNLAGAQMNFLPSIENIERIEIIRGPASSLYGSDAMGGVVNIITKKTKNKFTAGVITEYTKADSLNKVNNDSFQTSLYLNAPLIKDLLVVQFNGSYLNSDESDYHTNTTGSAGSDPDFKRRNFNTKLVFTPNNHNTISAAYMYTLQERTMNPGKSLALTSTDKSGNIVDNEQVYLKSIKYNYSLSHEASYDKFLVNSYINYDKAKNPSRINETTGNGIEFDTITVNSQGTYFFPANTTSVGLTYKTENLEDGATSSLNDSIVKMQRYQYSLFGENEWAITDDLSLTLSGRYDENEDFGSNFSPKAYLVYHLNDKFTLKGGMTSGYKAPSLRESATDFVGISRGGVKIGNPDLKPEKSLNTELGIAYNDYESGLNVSITAFQTDFEDKIQTTGKICAPNEICVNKGVIYDPHPYGYRTYENVDEAEIKGIEITTDLALTDTLLYRHSYTYTTSEQKTGTNQGRPLNNVSKHMFNAGLDWDASEKLNLWTQVNYRSETAGELSRSGEFNKQPAYTFVDIGLVYDITKKIALKTGIYNITNKEVTTDDGYGYILDGRRYNFAMNIKF